VSEGTLTLLWAAVDDPGAQRALETALREHAPRLGGNVEPAAGGAILASFRSAAAAIECAVALQRAGTKARIGLHSADAERRDGRLRGPLVLKAARVGDLARPAEIVASAVVPQLADGEHDLDEPRLVALRGLPGRHDVVSIPWEATARGPVRVVIADDSAIVRDGLAALLRDSDVEVVATATDAESLLAEVDRHRPDVAIVDIRMPPTFTTEGLVAAERIAAAHPQVGVLVLSQHVDAQYAQRLLGTGRERSGYLLKDRVADVRVLLDAVRRVSRGGCVVDPGLSEQLVRLADADGRLAELTDREREVLGLVAEGLSNGAIAERLVVTVRTIETHIGQIFLKLGLSDEGPEHRRVAAVVTYLRATG
jgi:DNA-binding NarL/FixJ family response regulator